MQCNLWPSGPCHVSTAAFQAIVTSPYMHVLQAIFNSPHVHVLQVYKAVTLQCLQRQPQNRPPATVIVGALEHLLANLNPVPPPETVMN